MNQNTDTYPATAALADHEQTHWQRLVVNALATMRRGHLRLLLPDGSALELGAEGGEAWHTSTRAPSALRIPQTATIRVLSSEFFRRCVLRGDIGFAESYMAGEWETPDPAAVIGWFLLNHDKAPTLSGSAAKTAGLNLLRLADRLSHLLRPNSRGTARRNISAHYDLSNDFFGCWLDKTMMYSSARWTTGEETLEQAQIAKNDALCRKLQLRPDDHVLEIGTGWGGWSLHAASLYGCKVTTLTLSEKQAALARQRVAASGLQDRIDVRVQDYRDLPRDEQYDKLVSIEMLEAVGHRYLEDWCKLVSRAVRKDGLMALQFITCADHRYEALRDGVDFIQKHIFPGSLLLSANRLNDLLSKTGGWVLHGLEDLGQDYARTLGLWRESFTAARADVRNLGFDETFLRKWDYYLAYCEAAFAMRHISVVQTVHTRPDNLKLA